MTEFFGEDVRLKSFPSAEDISQESPRTLVSPKIRVLGDNELEEPGLTFSNRNIVEVPAVLLSPCSRRASGSEQGLRSASSSEFLVPPFPLNGPRNRSTTNLARDEQLLPAHVLPRKLSLSLPLTPTSSTGLIFNSGPLNGYHTTGVPSQGDADILEDESSEFERRNNEYNEFSFECHGFLDGSLRGSTTSLREPNRLSLELENEATGKLPVASSTPNLHQSKSPCFRRPSTQLCCLPRTNYTELSTPSSECSSSRFSNQNLEGSGDDKGEELLSNEFHSCSENTDETDVPLLSRSKATQSSMLELNQQTTFLSPKYRCGHKQHSTPNLRLTRALTLPSGWRSSQKSLDPAGDVLEAEKSSPRFKSALRTTRNNTSKAFLHPDSARYSSSFEGSAVSLPQALSSRATYIRRKRTFSDPKRPRLRHQSCSINSSASSALEDSSAKSDTSFVKSFLSLISPSRLLSKFSSSKYSVRSTDSRSRRKRRHIDLPDDDKIVTLNVSGRRFQIRDYFLSIYPSTLLGGKARSLFYDKVRNEFFFDRDPDSFRYIWNFYHSGQLHCPREECVQSFLDEVAFFGLDISMLCGCCWQETFEPAHEKLTKRREEREAEEKEAAEATHILAPDATFREKAWITLQEPSYSFVAKMFYLLSVFVIVVSVVTNTAETIACKGAIRICKEENEETYFYIDTVCVGFFTFEYIARLIVCPNRLKFIINRMSIVDVLAILPYYIDLLLESISVGTSLGIDALVVLRVLRILRVFKLLRHSKRLKKLIQSMKDSSTELGLIGFLYLVIVILFSSIIYFTELSEDTQFTSIPEAMWYAVITSTTAG